MDQTRCLDQSGHIPGWLTHLPNLPPYDNGGHPVFSLKQAIATGAATGRLGPLPLDIANSSISMWATAKP